MLIESKSNEDIGFWTILLTIGALFLGARTSSKELQSYFIFSACSIFGTITRSVNNKKRPKRAKHKHALRDIASGLYA